MNQREKVLAGLSAAAIVGLLGWKLGGEALYDSVTGAGEEGGGGASAEYVEAKQAEVDQKLDILIEAPKIMEEYMRQVSATSVTSGGDPREMLDDLRPDLRMQEDVARLLALHGYHQPQIRPRVEEIKGVEDYELVLVTVEELEGNLNAISTVLKEFERAGFLLDEVEINNRMDREEMTAEVTLGRLVKAF